MPWHQAREGLVPLKCHQRAWWSKNSYLGHLHKNQQLWFGQQLCVPPFGFQRLGDCDNQHSNWWEYLRANSHHLEKGPSPVPKPSIWNVTFHNSCWTITTKKLFQKLFWVFLKWTPSFHSCLQPYFRNKILIGNPIDCLTFFSLISTAAEKYRNSS